MTTNIKKAVEILNEKFKSISDFKLNGDDDYHNVGLISGGFYWMNYCNQPHGRYAFHNIFFKGCKNMGVDEIVEAISEAVIKKLEWQKWCDEKFAEEEQKPINYKYNYSEFGL